MRKIFTFIFIFINFAILSAEIIETGHFVEINKYVTPKTLVILDIDDTLLIPTQTLGTDVWFLYRVQHHKDKGIEHSVAYAQALGEWEAIRHLTDVKIVEHGTEKIIEEMQNNKIVVIGLTTQGLALATRTVQQLKFLNIDLSKTAPSYEDHYFINQHGVLYRSGILFTSGTPKGPALLKLLDNIGFHPEHIVFINDKEKHLIDVEEAARARNIDFIGLRYNFSDERIAQFRKEIAEIQWEYSSFGHIISDAEAEELLLLKNRQ